VTQDVTQDEKSQDTTQDEEAITVQSSKSRSQRHQRDVSSRKSRKNKFLLDEPGINEISDELLGKTFHDAVTNTAQSFKAIASFRTSDFQEAGIEMGEELGEIGGELIANTKSFIDLKENIEDHFTVKTDKDAAENKSDKKGDELEARDDNASLKDSTEKRTGADDIAKSSSLCTDDETGTLLSDGHTGSTGADDSTFAGETTVTGDETTLTGYSELDYGAIMGDDGNHFKFLFGTFTQCLDNANCFSSNMYGDDAESELIEKKIVDWRKNLKGIDWKLIAREAEIEALGAATASTSEKKEKKWKKLFHRRRKQ